MTEFLIAVAEETWVGWGVTVVMNAIAITVFLMKLRSALDLQAVRLEYMATKMSDVASKVDKIAGEVIAHNLRISKIETIDHVTKRIVQSSKLDE